MPLKEPDLKDVDTYKKASRLDLPKVASGNAKFWIYKDVELPNASGKKQKYPAFLALVDDNGIRKFLTGKKLICKGTCGIKEERIAFDSLTGKVPYKVLKNSVPQLLGKPVLIPTGKEDDGGDEEGGEASAPGAVAGASIPAASAPTVQAPAPPLAAPASAAALTGAWTKLVKDVPAYAAANPDRKEALYKEMVAIGALLKANNAAEAKPKMDQMQATLDAPPAAKPAGTPVGAAQATARWNAVVKQMQAAVAAHPERKADLVRAHAGIQEAFRTGKFDVANKLMDTIDAALRENPREKEYRTRYQTLEGRLVGALKDPARDAGSLRAMSAIMVEKANAGDFEAAWKALLQLEEALAAAPAAAGAKPAAEEDAEAEEAEEAEDEEEKKEASAFQKDLKGRMVTAMAQVRARPPEDAGQLLFMAYLAGKNNAVIVAKKVGGATKKLLAEIAGASGGKLLRGECIFEKSAHTFVSAKVPGGLAKKLAAALLVETGQKYKVRVRSIDGSVDLDSETDVDPDAAPVSEVESPLGEARPEGPIPFQIFVKSVDNVTLTIALPNGPQTTIAELQELIESRTGIAPSEQNLNTGVKPVNSRHAQLPVSEYGIQGNQTLTLLGRLKGGFGERAAIADAVLKDIKHGNVLGDIQATRGKSKAKKDLCRTLTNYDKPEGKQYLDSVVAEAVRLNIVANNDTAKKQWLAQNKHFIKSLAIGSAQAGNCGDYAQVVYSHLLSNTQGQTVYQVVMSKPYDHQFVVTSPEDHKNDINALINDREAMVADAWWQNTICTFKSFVAGKNPYGEKVGAANLKIVKIAAAAGQKLDPAVAAFAKDEIEKLYTRYDKTVTTKAASHDTKATRLATAKEQAAQSQLDYDEIESILMEEGGDTPKNWERWNELYTKLEDAKKEQAAAVEDFKGVFGAPNVAWDSGMRDERSEQERYQTFNQAFKKGGISQLEKEMEQIEDHDFLLYLVTSDSSDWTQNAVLSSPSLAARLAAICTKETDEGLVDIWTLLTDTHFGNYAASSAEICSRLKTIPALAERISKDNDLVKRLEILGF